MEKKIENLELKTIAYTFRSIKKHISFKLGVRELTSEEIERLLMRTFTYIDMSITEFLNKHNEEWHIKYAGCKTANTAIQEEIKELKRENEQLSRNNVLTSLDFNKMEKERNDAVNHYNWLVSEIISDIPFTGIRDTDETVQSHLYKMQKALKAIEEIEKILDESYRTGRRTLALAKIRDKINEVLNEQNSK